MLEHNQFEFLSSSSTISSLPSSYVQSKPKAIANNNNNHRNSIDAGYESLLSQSCSSFYSTSSSSTHSNTSRLSTESTTSVPTTPVKIPTTITTTTTTTPNGKHYFYNSNQQQQSNNVHITADVNSMYFASLRHHYNHPHVDTASFMSPIKSGSCSSNSNSPLLLLSGSGRKKYGQQQQLEEFVSERSDEFVSRTKLLKSPSVSYSPYKLLESGVGGRNGVRVSSFSSRLQSIGVEKAVAMVAEKSVDDDVNVVGQHRVSPTEEEFIDILYKNKHIPADPQTLIGMFILYLGHNKKISVF